MRLYPTQQAYDNLRRLRDVRSRLLDGIVNDPEEIDTAISTLRRLETELTARSATRRLIIGSEMSRVRVGADSSW